MRFLATILIVFLLITPIYSIVLNNRAGVTISSGDLFGMASAVYDTYGVEVTQLTVYYERNVLVYEFKGYKTNQEGYTIREIPYTLKLNENLDPFLTPVVREDRIGYRAVFLGLPGILSYLVYKVVGVL